jgi:hypothetical protein
MAFASQYELIATIIQKDRYIVEIDEFGVGELLTNLLRTCHDYSDSPKWEASDLAEAIASTILGWTSGQDLVLWPEDEGDGPVDWKALDDAPAPIGVSTASAADAADATALDGLPPLTEATR